MSDHDDFTTVRLDGTQMRALAHPLRARLLGALRLDGPATATTLARALDTNTGATSYHLRRLADVGLVVEEDRPDAGGRERWWRAAHDFSDFSARDFEGDPDAAAAHDWFQRWAARKAFDGFEAWLDAAPADTADWRDAAGPGDLKLHIGPDRLRALTDEVWALLERYEREAPADEPDAREVIVATLVYPRVDSARREPGPPA
ncbi:ArsR/SmtB family transcription factor [Agromyces seonyuensis]|uniref:Helix-turn-helix domain-containing protein n=1 Tax=Agromyces seonyuensis TaxID=2662446 RepID=A0A6I4NYU2_9MICO|nr:helix-turn-helix domain-containing protein [Agromyces seonyuensis]MWB99503.1 helix-turn-helix domain-containing protein [Agromyces seonyuensis]